MYIQSMWILSYHNIYFLIFYETRSRESGSGASQEFSPLATPSTVHKSQRKPAQKPGPMDKFVTASCKKSLEFCSPLRSSTLKRNRDQSPEVGDVDEDFLPPTPGSQAKKFKKFNSAHSTTSTVSKCDTDFSVAETVWEGRIKANGKSCQVQMVHLKGDNEILKHVPILLDVNCFHFAEQNILEKVIINQNGNLHFKRLLCSNE